MSRRLLAACPDKFEGRREKALVALLADSGLRISEGLRLRIEDVRFESARCTCEVGKGRYLHSVMELHRSPCEAVLPSPLCPE
jgi:integrase